ncbi:hypothetical protein PLESTM_000196300 [Pleodorina starrii]|nr:hypothetical protein PLESTM_000196300 [Pleodorina starrii]
MRNVYGAQGGMTGQQLACLAEAARGGSAAPGGWVGHPVEGGGAGGGGRGGAQAPFWERGFGKEGVKPALCDKCEGRKTGTVPGARLRECVCMRVLLNMRVGRGVNEAMSSSLMCSSSPAGRRSRSSCSCSFRAGEEA